MPRGRRKIPFSGKAKKQQLQERRVRKASSHFDGECSSAAKEYEQSRIMKINSQPSPASKSKSTRYALKFMRESNEVIKMKKEEAERALSAITEFSEIDSADYYSSDLDFPKRPRWDRSMTREELDRIEQSYFNDFISRMTERDSPVSFFELNLETWRQFWRVVEKSDIILLIVDVRFPSLMFHPSLYYYVTGTLNKSIIMVLNKIDLVPASVVVAWKTYFAEKFPSMHVIIFTSLPEYNLRKGDTKSGLHVCRTRGIMKMAAEGAQTLLNVCAKIVGNKVDLSSWQKKIEEEINESEGELIIQNEYVLEEKASYTEYEIFHQGILTIGTIGFPNAGKSSLLNGLMGKKVVSVSKTPGHTKHFQTIFLTPTVRLCDCPGLAFPSSTPKHLQVLMGSFPIAQLQEPYTSVKFLAEHVDLVRLLSLQHPTGDVEWSAMDICTAWAQKRGFMAARSARPDVYRAANHILRMALEGKFRFSSHPPGYSAKKDFWEKHEDVQTVLWILGDPDSKPIRENLEHLSDLEEDIETEDSDNTSIDSEDSGDANAKVFQENKFSVLERTT